MEDSNEGERTFNKYVSTLVETVDRAASAVHQTVIEIAPPIKTPTPYGGRYMGGKDNRVFCVIYVIY